VSTIAYTRSTEQQSRYAGVRAMAPLMLAYTPFALVIGVAVAQVSDPVAGWSGSWLIYGGSAHLAALKGLAAGGVAGAIIVPLLINTRMLLYSASIARRWREQPAWFRIVAAAFLVDPTWALADRHAASEPSLSEQRSFFLGAAITMGVWWSAMIAAGAIAGNRLPHFGLELVAPVCLISLVGSRIRGRSHQLAAIAAAASTLFAPALPAGLSLIAAIAIGCGVAHVSDRWAR
jgi:predicted branched-subunit amino acid permease